MRSGFLVLLAQVYLLSPMSYGAERSFLFWSDNALNFIGRVQLDNKAVTIVKQDQGGDVAVAFKAGRLFWSRILEGRILTGNYDGDGATTILQYSRAGIPGRAHYLFVDSPRNRLVWTDNSWLYSSDLDGKNVRMLRNDFVTGSEFGFGGVVLDKSGNMYYLSDNASGSGLFKTNSQGDQRELILKFPGYKRGLAIDDESKTLYFAAKNQGVFSFDLNSRVLSILSSPDQNATSNPIGVAFVPYGTSGGPELYWTEQQQCNCIRTLDLKSLKQTDFIQAPGKGIFNLTFGSVGISK